MMDDGSVPDELLDPIKARWAVVWPVYLNSKKTTKQGRRVPMEIAVDNPTLDEIAQACQALGLATHVERTKKYPRDFLLVGRVRVELKDENGTLTKPEITNRTCFIFILFFYFFFFFSFHSFNCLYIPHAFFP